MKPEKLLATVLAEFDKKINEADDAHDTECWKTDKRVFETTPRKVQLEYGEELLGGLRGERNKAGVKISYDYCFKRMQAATSEEQERLRWRELEMNRAKLISTTAQQGFARMAPPRKDRKRRPAKLGHYRPGQLVRRIVAHGYNRVLHLPPSWAQPGEEWRLEQTKPGQIVLMRQE